MNSHAPFDSCQPWGEPHCGTNRSNDPLVDKLIGNAYHVVRTVYHNLGNLRIIYDYLNQYGMIMNVRSEEELKSLSINGQYARIYGFNELGNYVITDYLYVDGDLSGIIPDDPTATGSWIEVSSSNRNGGLADQTYLTYVYSNGSAVGGETTITVPVYAKSVPFLLVNGEVQTDGYGFEFNSKSKVVSLAQELEPEDEVVLLMTTMPGTPNEPNVSNWKVINWLYNYGAAVGGEQVINLPFSFQDIPGIFVNGNRYYPGLATQSYTIDADNKRIILSEPLSTDDRVIVQIGGELETIQLNDRTLFEVARGLNLKDSEVILDTDTTSYLNDKKVVYVTAQQKSYKLPQIPTNVRISSVAGNKLTYVPGNAVVTLEDITIVN